MSYKDKSQLNRMKELADILNKAAKAYYTQSSEVISNKEYDALYDELVELENKTGTILSSSPTQNVGYEVSSELPKEEHEKPMLSLDKTKSVDELVSWLGNQKGILSWKLDGLTIVLTYNHGELVKAVTRGNGYIGEVITNNAKTFDNIPLKIPYQGELILRGEATISYSEFNRINEEIADIDAKYKNPRNLCSGSVRQLDPSITRSRHVSFTAFILVKADGIDFQNSREKQFDFLSEQGFDVVYHVEVSDKTLPKEVKTFSEKIQDEDKPSDGLVLLMDDIAYGDLLGATAKFPRNSIAFKWSDEVRETKMLYTQWSPSRTGLINPVAVFEPVELEGTTVSRASVHNVSIYESLMLAAGDIVTVYKANMIIPQIADNLSKTGPDPIPDRCPICGKKTKIKDESGIKTLYCTNPDCVIKKIKSFALFTSRNAFNIEGLSEATLEKFIAKGFIHEYADIFKLSVYRDSIVDMDGFGEKSYTNLIEAIDRSRHIDAARFVYSLGIAGIGYANAKVLARHYGTFDNIRNADIDELTQIDGIGSILASAIVDFLSDKDNNKIIDNLLEQVDISSIDKTDSDGILNGKIFVITGDISHYKNRDELKEEIESLGGKATGSVSTKTSYLINNDVTSTSGKNKKAKELGIPIISEEEYMKMVGKDI